MADLISLDNLIIRGLACAAIHPGLHGILLIDASPNQVVRYCEILAQMLAVVMETDIPLQTSFTTNETEDVLWGIPLGINVKEKNSFVWNGRIQGGRSNDLPQVVGISNLTQLSLPAERAFVMIGDSPVVHLERHGQHLHWEPKIWWIAGCSQADFGKVSQHILDRFPLRLQLTEKTNNDELIATAQLLDRISQSVNNNRLSDILPEHIVWLLKRASQTYPLLSASLLNSITNIVPKNHNYSFRRDLSVARLVAAHAMLLGKDIATLTDFQESAQMMGFTLDIASNDPINENIDSAIRTQYEQHQLQVDTTVDVKGDLPLISVGTDKFNLAVESIPIYPSDATQILSPAILTSQSQTPWQEDMITIEREPSSLRLPLRNIGHSQASKGAIIGVEPSTTLDDLAVIYTLFEAYKHQAIRNRQIKLLHKGLVLRPTDLRRYRRSSVSEASLILVIDYTSLRRCDWETSLIPHLDWAYTKRASISLIRVGAAQSLHELRAEQIIGRNLLDPKIDAALVSLPGRATPLAHGLNLALQHVRHLFQQRKTSEVNARLVILSDGRGNVPLSDSYAGFIKSAVNREGIEDAFNVALQLAQLKRILIVYLDPQPAQYAELPNALAQTLGVVAQPIPKIESNAYIEQMAKELKAIV